MMVSRVWRTLIAYASVVGWLRAMWFTLLESLTSTPRLVTISLEENASPLRVRLRTSDLAVVAQVFRKGEYDVDYGIRPRTIVDAGANIGASSIYFASRFPDARVVAVEPDPGNYAVLVENVSHWASVIPLHAALWSEDTRVKVIDPGSGMWGYQVAPSDEGEIRGLSVETLMAVTEIEQIDLLKLDIEGAERELLAGGPAWLSRVRSIVIELHEAQTPGCIDAFESVTRDFPIRFAHGEHVIARRR